MNEYQVKEIVRSAQGGSQEAFAELYHMYKRQILNYLYGYLGNFDTAQEIAQDVFINAYKGLGAFKGECKFLTWLYTIATNLAKNYLMRKSKRQEQALASPIDPAGDMTLEETLPDRRPRPDEEMNREMLQEEIRRAIDLLPEKYRQVILLCDVEELSYEEAAGVLGCNVGTIGSRLNEARKMFRKNFRPGRG